MRITMNSLPPSGAYFFASQLDGIGSGAAWIRSNYSLSGEIVANFAGVDNKSGFIPTADQSFTIGHSYSLSQQTLSWYHNGVPGNVNTALSIPGHRAAHHWGK